MKSGIAVAPQSPSLLPVALLVETAPRSEPEGVGGAARQERADQQKEEGLGEAGPSCAPSRAPGPRGGGQASPHHPHSYSLLTPLSTPLSSRTTAPGPPPSRRWRMSPSAHQGHIWHQREGAFMGVTQRQTLGTVWLARGLRISQSHHIQSHKYPMIFDPQ